MHAGTKSEEKKLKSCYKKIKMPDVEIKERR